MVIITTIGKDLTLLEKWIYYYSILIGGRNDFHFIINNDEKYKEIKNKIESLLIDYNHDRVNFYKMSGEFSETKKIELERSIASTINGYILYADLDEFIYFPGGLDNRLKLMHSFGESYIEGRMIDRVANDGYLIEYDNNKFLEDQFPIGCDITKSICGGWNKKIVLAYSKLLVGGGHHVFENEVEYNNTKAQPYNDEMSPWSYGVEIHHFKWNSNIENKMKTQLEYKDESLNAWKDEMNRFVDSFYNVNSIPVIISDGYNLSMKHTIIKRNNIDLTKTNHYYIGRKLDI